MLGAKDLLRAVAGQVLHHVGVLAAAVVAASGIALGILVGEDRAGRLQHRLGDKVLAGNHLQPLVLAEGFVVNGGGHFGVGLGEGERHAIGHTDNSSVFQPPATDEFTRQISCFCTCGAGALVCPGRFIRMHPQREMNQYDKLVELAFRLENGTIFH